LLVVLLLLAFWVITTNLTWESMWADEAASWGFTRAGLDYVFLSVIKQDVHPPTYYIYVWLWRTWMSSDNLFILRLCSVFPALLAIAFCYRVGRDWFSNRWVGLGAMAFLMTSGVFIYHARELRMYPIIVLMALVSWWFLWRLVNDKRAGWWQYTLWVILMAYTYYYLADVVLMQLIFVALFYRTKIWRVIAPCVIALIAFLPWLPIFILQLRTARAQANDPNAPIIGKFLGTVSTNAGAITDLILSYTAKQPIFVIFLIIVGLSAIFVLPAKSRRWVIAAALWLFLTLILFLSINLVIPIYGPRFVLFVLPAVALLVGLAVYRMPDRRIRTATVSVLLIGGLVTHQDGFLSPHTPHRDLLATVSEHYLPGDRIWYNLDAGALGSSVLASEESYHLIHDAPNLKLDYFVWAAPSEFVDVKTTRRVWDIRPYWVDIPPQIVEPLQNGRAVTEQYTILAYTIRLYEAPPQDAPAIFGDMLAMKVSPPDQASYHPNDVVTVPTWWQAQKQVPLDYSIGLILTKDGSTDPVAQLDKGLVINKLPTSQLVPSDNFTLDNLSLTLPGNLAPGDYSIWAALYFYQTPDQRLTITADKNYTSDQSRLLLRHLKVVG
jgi:hypothetical protein